MMIIRIKVKCFGCKRQRCYAFVVRDAIFKLGLEMLLYAIESLVFLSFHESSAPLHPFVFYVLFVFLYILFFFKLFYSFGFFRFFLYSPHYIYFMYVFH